MATKPIYDIINAEYMGAYIQDMVTAASQAEPFLLSTLFPAQRTDKLEVSYLRTKGNIDFAIKASTFNSNAPILPRESLSKVTEEIPFFRMADLIDERELKELNAFLSNSAEEALINSAIVQLFDRPMKLFLSAIVQMENMIAQLITTGKIHINESAVDGQKIGYDYDFGSAEWTKSNVITLENTRKWVESNRNGSKPLEDIADVINKADINGVSIDKIIMNKRTLNAMRTSDSIKPITISPMYGGGIITKPQLIEQVQIASEDATVEIYNKSFQNEVGKTKMYIPDGIIVFAPAGALGSSIYGTTPEEIVGEAKAYNTNVVLGNGISLAQWVDEHPVKHWTAVSMFGMPILPRQQEVFVLKVF